MKSIKEIRYKTRNRTCLFEILCFKDVCYLHSAQKRDQKETDSMLYSGLTVPRWRSLRDVNWARRRGGCVVPRATPVHINCTWTAGVRGESSSHASRRCFNIAFAAGIGDDAKLIFLFADGACARRVWSCCAAVENIDEAAGFRDVNWIVGCKRFADGSAPGAACAHAYRIISVGLAFCGGAGGRERAGWLAGWLLARIHPRERDSRESENIVSLGYRHPAAQSRSREGGGIYRETLVNVSPAKRSTPGDSRRVQSRSWYTAHPALVLSVRIRFRD